MQTFTDSQLMGMVMRIVCEKDYIDERATYLRFVKDLGDLITGYCGGEIVTVTDVRKCIGDYKVEVAIAWDERIPDDGGVFVNYGEKLTVAQWREKTCSESSTA